MFQELSRAAREAAGALILLAFSVAAAAVVGLVLLGGGVEPRLAAAAALMTPGVCGLAFSAALGAPRVGLAGAAATLAAAHALLPAHDA